LNEENVVRNGTDRRRGGACELLVVLFSVAFDGVAQFSVSTVNLNIKQSTVRSTYSGLCGFEIGVNLVVGVLFDVLNPRVDVRESTDGVGRLVLRGLCLSRFRPHVCVSRQFIS